MDEEESYFDCDDGEDEGMNGQNTSSIDNESDLHRTPRMFALSEQGTSLESHGTNVGEEKSGEGKEGDSGETAGAAGGDEGGTKRNDAGS